MSKGSVYPGLGQKDSMYSIILVAVKYDIMADFKDTNFIDDVSKKSAGDVIKQFVLPLPNNIAESVSHGWEITEGMTEQLGGILSGAGEAIAGGTVAEVAKKKLNSAGINIDPNYRQIYNGTQPRTFDFNWIFIPQNKADSKWIHDTIKLIKKYSSPQGRTAEILIEPPLSWKIYFTNGIVNSLLNMQTFVITSFSADYTAQGYGNFFKDGTPKQINMSITFSERYALEASDWN